MLFLPAVVGSIDVWFFKQHFSHFLRLMNVCVGGCVLREKSALNESYKCVQRPESVLPQKNEETPSPFRWRRPPLFCFSRDLLLRFCVN
jgi:hypothetical protein